MPTGQLNTSGVPGASRDDAHRLWPLPAVGATVVGGFESSHFPLHGVDGFGLSGHDALWREDLDAVLNAGVRHLRYPIRWPQVELERGRYDWRATDEVMQHLRERGVIVIVDLLHHTSYPSWLRGGFLDPAFGEAFLRYVRAVVERYPWIAAYTLFNEPFVTMFLSGHEGVWPPFARGIPGFLGVLRSVLPTLVQAAEIARVGLPHAHHVWIDSGEAHSGVASGAAYAQLANDRRHSVLDLFLGHDLDPERPFLKMLFEQGGHDLFELPPSRVDVLGVDYYPQAEWFFDDRGAHSPSPRPVGLRVVFDQYWTRYGLPMMLTETNIRGLPTDRASWLKYVLEQYESALSDGVPLHGLCWFPQLDSVDWDSMLSLSLRRVDPVGVWSLTAAGRRTATVFTKTWEAVVAGACADELTAYSFEHPCEQRLAGFAPMMSHWSWREPGQLNRSALQPMRTGAHTVAPGADGRLNMRKNSRQPAPDLVVLSHLRWPWVWQRPQHLVSRLAASRAETGRRTFFVEEPLPADVPVPELLVEHAGPIVRIVLLVPDAPSAPYLGFAHPDAADYPRRVALALAERGAGVRPDAWLYTPMALPFLTELEPALVIYDVMDDLASFAGAPAGLRERQLELLATADLVFTGGRSLHRSTTKVRTADVHLFASGVETGHYAAAKPARLARPTGGKVAGYVGVIDERLDLDLIAGLAEHLSDWTISMVGPVAKIDERDLPRAPNIEYRGMIDYADLPPELARFDVALMPFALNDATAHISPTKTLEYFAAGLPVVSTRVPDVVADYIDAVYLADDAPGFAQACRRAAGEPGPDESVQIQTMLRRREWDFIADAMNSLVESTRWRTGDAAIRRQTARVGGYAGSIVMARELAEAHRLSVRAATDGIQDPALGTQRLAGDSVSFVAEAAVSSATPYLRAPLLARMGAATRLHPGALIDGVDGLCPTCQVPVPCPTAQALAS